MLRVSLLIVLVFLTLFRHWNADRVVPRCVKEYIDDIQSLGLNAQYIEAVRSRTENDLSLVPPAYSGPRVVLDIGPGAIMHSPVFKHLTQLNFPGFDRRGRSSYDCRFEKDPSIRKGDLYSLGSKYIQASGKVLHLPVITNWLGLLNKQPNTMIILNDMSDEEYYQSALKPECKTAQRDAADHCCVPLLPVGYPFTADRINLASKPYWLESFSLETVKAMLAAYRKLITCVVPPEQLLVVNIDKTPPEDYWSKLTSFLNITTSPSQLPYLARGGSICADPSQYLPEPRVKVLDQCAGQYADTMAASFGAEFRSLLFNRLREPPLYRRRAPNTTRRLVLNAGPGTTATRSLHLAMALLNITARHYLAFNNTLGPPTLSVYDIDSDMKVLELDKSDRPIYWSDTPVAERWWHLLQYYPLTKVLVTDVRNDTQWFEKRIKDHCKNSDTTMVWNYCGIPMPVDFFLSSPLSIELFHKVHLMKTNASMNHVAFEAFRELIRCAVPPEQLKWIFVSEYSATTFWKELVSFVGVNVSAEALDALIAGGVPRCGSTGCMFGGKKVYSGMY